jgi:hypothetical protein
MKRLLCGVLLLAAGSLMAQQQDSPAHNSPPNGASPNIQQEQQAPTAPASPDVPAPSVEANQDIQQQIQKDLSAEPVLATSVVDVVVYDNAIVLMGTVGDEEQHTRVLQIAAPYAGERVIVDGIKPQEKTGYQL